MRLYNTLSRQIEEFKPLNPPIVTFYSCGPTVYDYTHIGHMRTFINNDVLKRTLNYLGFKVKHVMNITDVGHLTSDADEGDDKLEKGAKNSGKTVWEIAKFYTDYFLKTLASLNIIKPNILCKATDNIDEMIRLIQILETKGFTYETDEALYFDITKFPNYGKLSGQKLEDKIKGSREEVYVDPKKKNSADFALWFKRIGRFANHSMYWNSPWSDGFPGWHIECSAMSMKFLNTSTLDIHSGGIDHIPVHHENEIAQSEAVTGKQFVRYWVHFQFLLVNNQKMSKSLRNFYTIDDVKKHNIDLLALRLLFLQTHYRQIINFTCDSSKAESDAYDRLKQIVIVLRKQTDRTVLSEDKLQKLDEYRRRFIDAITNDLQTPQAVAIMWEMLKSNIPSTDKLDLLFEFDQIFGLKLNEITEDSIPQEIITLANLRQQKRLEKNFNEADRLRKDIENKGYLIEDIDNAYKLRKK